MNQILLIHIFISPVLLAVSLLMKLWPPKKINSFYGYRTPRSMRNQFAWTEANAYSADLMVWAGISTLFVQVLSYFFIGGVDSVLITLGYFILFVFISIALTERRSKAKGF